MYFAEIPHLCEKAIFSEFSPAVLWQGSVYNVICFEKNGFYFCVLSEKDETRLALIVPAAQIDQLYGFVFFIHGDGGGVSFFQFSIML